MVEVQKERMESASFLLCCMWRWVVGASPRSCGIGVVLAPGDAAVGVQRMAHMYALAVGGNCGRAAFGPAPAPGLARTVPGPLGSRKEGESLLFHTAETKQPIQPTAAMAVADVVFATIQTKATSMGRQKYRKVLMDGWINILLRLEIRP